MDNSREIYENLMKNADDPIIADFINEIFIKEFKGLKRWNKPYDDLIDKYSKLYRKDGKNEI